MQYRIGFQANVLLSVRIEWATNAVEMTEFATEYEAETHVGAIRTIRNISNIFAHNCNIKANIESGSDVYRVAL